METLFENDDFILKSTGHNYDFVGIIETKGYKPLTFFFGEQYVPHDEEDELEWDSWDYEDNIDESKTEFLGVWKGLEEYNPDSDSDEDEEQEISMNYRSSYPEYALINYFRTRDDGSTGFLSDPRDRGQFLALIKAYCPEKLKLIDWA